MAVENTKITLMGESTSIKYPMEVRNEIKFVIETEICDRWQLK